jgi:cardiolipin synthase
MAFFSQWLTTDNITLAIGAVIILYWVAVTLILIWEDREPYDTLAWILVLALFPVFGLILYFFAGKNWPAITMKRRWFLEMLSIRRPYMDVIYKRYQSLAEELLNPEDRGVEDKVVSTIRAENEAGPLPARTFKVYPSGEEYFPILIQDIYNARRFIHMQYFIWEQDRLTAELVPILLDRLQAGVEVRIMYDWMGCITFRKSELRQLRRAGAQVEADVTDLLRINYRNHRKIVVIDGEIGYTGGMNVGQEYIDGGDRFATWRDTHLRLTGQAVAALEKLFAARWFEHDKKGDGENLFAAEYMPTPQAGAVEQGTLVEVAAQGVEDPWRAARRTHMVAIGQAEESVWIQSPYFIPDYSIYDVMINAALSGVDVRFMMTGIPDKPIALWAAQTYYRKLIEAGARVFLYEAGFLHAKTIVVDHTVSAVGTMNMDQRSLKLHKEMMVWVFDKGFARQVADQFAIDMTNCREVTLEDVLSVGRLKKFRNQAARLFSNVL